jgi:hypothetical protein
MGLSGRDNRPEADQIDPRLVAHFAIFGDGPEALECLPDDQHQRIMATVLEHHGPGVAQLALDLSMARQVALSASLTVLIAPGRNGAFMLTPDESGGLTIGFGALVQFVLTGQPLGRSGSTLFGLSPDGVTDQAIILRDGSTSFAQVIHNAYTYIDPSLGTQQ